MASDGSSPAMMEMHLFSSGAMLQQTPYYDKNRFKCFITYRRNMKRSKTLMNEGHSPRTRRNRRRGAFWGRLWLVWSPFSLMPWAQWVCAAVILRRCAPVTLDAPGQSEGEIPTKDPPHTVRLPAGQSEEEKGTFNPRPWDVTPSAGRHMTVKTVALKVRQVPVRQLKCDEKNENCQKM